MRQKQDHGEDSYKGFGAHCREIVERTAKELGRLDILVNNITRRIR